MKTIKKTEVFIDFEAISHNFITHIKSVLKTDIPYTDIPYNYTVAVLKNNEVVHKSYIADFSNFNIDNLIQQIRNKLIEDISEITELNLTPNNIKNHITFVGWNPDLETYALKIFFGVKCKDLVKLKLKKIKYPINPRAQWSLKNVFLSLESENYFQQCLSNKVIGRYIRSYINYKNEPVLAPGRLAAGFGLILVLMENGMLTKKLPELTNQHKQIIINEIISYNKADVFKMFLFVENKDDFYQMYQQVETIILQKSKIKGAIAKLQNHQYILENLQELTTHVIQSDDVKSIRNFFNKVISIIKLLNITEDDIHAETT
ncbi:hypothetical protein, partial [Mycoplasma nasistruthionis]|uniref:hypothetical protein n=1 Tax=Mycoplasma nasistruthionis TaxID=353852 RepID=UPI001ABF919C